MRIRILLLALSLGLPLGGLPSVAVAGGLSLRWTNSTADGGTTNLAFACNTNTTARVLVPSFILDSYPFSIARVEGTIDVVSSSPVLPPWWELQAGCRSGALTADVATVGPILCEAWGGFTSNDGILGYVVGTSGPNTATLTFASIRGPVLPPLSAGIEYVATGVRLSTLRTVGSPSCSGCDIGVCLELRQLRMLSSSGLTVLTITAPISAGGQRVTWQGGGPGPGATCLAATPTRRSAWGAIKSLYR